MSWLDAFFLGGASTLIGDVNGTVDDNTVDAIHGISVGATGIANGAFLVGTGTTSTVWREIVAADIPAPVGDVTNTYAATRVTGIGTGGGNVGVHAANFIWDSSLSASLSIATTGGPAGGSFTISAGTSSSGGGFGGALNLTSGGGGATPGALNLQINGTTSVNIAATTGQVNLGANNKNVQVGASGSSVGAYGKSPIAKPSITGVLSAVADANAKAVLTSIINAFDSTNGIGFVANTTT
jgi:hypothetical protein